MTERTAKPVTAMVLAGKRSGALDALAAEAGVAQKCVVPVAGKPMIEHTLSAVARCPDIGPVRIIAHETEEIAALPLVAQLIEERRLTFHEAAFNLVDSVIAGAQGADFPILVTTADNCLVTPEGYSEMIRKALKQGLDAASAMARKEDVQAADPEGQSKFYRFADGEFSNCNMYWAASERALSATEVFRSGGQFVKFPSRIGKAFGLRNLALFYLGIGSRRKLFAQISRRFGLKMAPIIVSSGEYAIDVDNERTLRVTERLLRRRTEAA